MFSGEHQGYWSQYPGHYEHWRFDEGFLRGWDDAWLFFRSISSLPPNAFIPELGFKGPWLKMRLKEHTATKGTGNLWEYGELSLNLPSYLLYSSI